MGGVSGEVESEIRERGGDGSIGYGGDAVMGVGKYEEGTRMVGAAVLVVPDGCGDTNGMEAG